MRERESDRMMQTILEVDFACHSAQKFKLKCYWKFFTVTVTHRHAHMHMHTGFQIHIYLTFTHTQTHTRIAEIQLEFSVFFHQLLCSQLAPALQSRSLSPSLSFPLSLNCLPSLAICFHLPHISYSFFSNALGARTQREIVLCGLQMGVAVGHSWSWRRKRRRKCQENAYLQR